MPVERTVPIDEMPYEPWPSVPDLAPGDIVVGIPHARRFKVLRVDEWVVTGERDPWAKPPFDRRVCTGPYARLQALDDKRVEVIWSSDWYAPGWAGDLI